MVLVHTTGTSGEGEEKERRYAKMKDGRLDVRRWKLKQPHVHNIYRTHFNRVDLFNRHTLGVKSVQSAVHCYEWWKRMFLALLGCCVTNAYLAYCIYLREQGAKPPG